MTYDVVITGGGLSGLALCINLSLRGYSVCVVEKGSYPRHKVCGEYISMESQNYLERICPGLLEYKLPLIQKFKLTSTGKKDFYTPLGLGGFGVSRYLLEDLLYKQATKQGVVFLLNNKVTNVNYDAKAGSYDLFTGSGDQVSGKLVCNASGRRSNLEKTQSTASTGTNYVGIKYHVKIARDPALIEIHNFPGGYCGISNVEENTSCLCYIVNSKELAGVKKSIPELEAKILSQNPHLKKIFSEAEFVFNEPLAISGINFLIKEPVNDSAFFLGDAAGSIAPVTGNGMSMGLRSANTLADLIHQYFSGNMSKDQLTKTYVAFWNSQFSGRVKLSRYFQKLSEYPSLTNLTIQTFNTFPFLARMAIRSTHGKPF